MLLVDCFRAFPAMAVKLEETVGFTSENHRKIVSFLPFSPFLMISSTQNQRPSGCRRTLRPSPAQREHGCATGGVCSAGYGDAAGSEGSWRRRRCFFGFPMVFL